MHIADIAHAWKYANWSTCRGDRSQAVHMMCCIPSSPWPAKFHASQHPGQNICLGLAARLVCTARLACCVQGWIDITYLSADGSFRLSKGNKGTTFVLARDRPLREQLLSALQSKTGSAQIHRLAEDLAAAGGGDSFPAESSSLPGNWTLKWAAQVCVESYDCNHKCCHSHEHASDHVGVGTLLHLLAPSCSM